MKAFDIIMIGAGPAMFGAVAGIFDQVKSFSKLSALHMTGEILNDPGVSLSRLGPFDRRPNWSSKHFGLPAVRAFGDGGSSQIWHGGLFIPHSDDDIFCLDADSSDKRFDFQSSLSSLCNSSSLSSLNILKSLREVNYLSKREDNLTSCNWRKMLLPRRPPLLSPNSVLQNNISKLKSFNNSPAAAISLNKSSTGRWKINSITQNGLEELEAKHIIMGAGCLSSLKLLTTACDLKDTGYTDHLHVFVGVVSRKSIPNSLLRKISARSDESPGYITRSNWKTTIQTNSKDFVDISLSFRSVANPNFPRSGRRFGEFIGSRSSSINDKILLCLKNPLTAVELLAYKYGVELPFDHLLVHATISPRIRTGLVGEGCLTFSPDRQMLAECAATAFDEFVKQNALSQIDFTGFELDDVSASLISGAQFCAGMDQPTELKSFLESNAHTLHVCDTSSMAFTSTYNQGLISLTRGYISGLNAAKSF